MKIVLTGGPSAGKTALVDLVAKQFYKDITAVQEAATILFKGGLPRESASAPHNHEQRAIYYLQIELEAIATLKDINKILICDHGTVDGAAYWCGPYVDFFASVQTTLEKELSRYDYIIHLETPNELYYDHSNPVRNEEPRQAQILDNKIKEVWNTHPSRLVVHCHKNFGEKVKEVLDFISTKVNKSRENQGYEKAI